MLAFELDVRSILRDGGEPFPQIMQAVSTLKTGQSLKLLAPFRPVPLFQAMQKKGYSYAALEIGDGDWEVIFTPVISEEAMIKMQPVSVSVNAVVPEIWPDPMHYLDCMNLNPTEISEEILGLLNEMEEGAVIFAALSSQPVILLTQLEQYGHQWVGNFDASGDTYRIMIRVGHMITA